MKSWGKQKEGRMGHDGNALVQQQSYLRRGWGGRQSVDHSIFCVMVVLAADSVSEYFCPFIIQNEAH